MDDHDLIERARLCARRILRSSERKSPVPAQFMEHLELLMARHWVKTGTAFMHNGRLAVNPETRKSAVRTARSIEWMSNPDRQFGQQDQECAHETLRALTNRRISLIDLEKKCAEFQRRRNTIISRKSDETAWAEQKSVDLPTFGMTAHWLVTNSAVRKVGSLMRNCLARKDFASFYKSRIREGVLQLACLYKGNIPEVILKIDSHSNVVEEVKGSGNSLPIQHRGAIIDLLVDQHLGAGDCDDLHELGICDELLSTRAAHTNALFTIGDRHCEVVTGFLSITWDSNCIVLRINSDGEIRLHGPEGLIESLIRVWVRAACDKCPAFRSTCVTAFVDALHHERCDWFTVD